MTASARADERDPTRPAPSIAPDGTSSGALRIAVLDRDSGFIQVLSKRLDRLGWEHRVLAGPVPTDAIASMRPRALVVGVRVLRLGADDWITKPCHPEEVIARVQGVARRRRRATGRADVKPLLAGEV